MTIREIIDWLFALAILTGFACIVMGVLVEVKDRQERRKAPTEIPPVEEGPALPPPAQNALAKEARTERLRVAYSARRRTRVQKEIDKMVREAGCV